MSGIVGRTSIKSGLIGRPIDSAKAWARINLNTPVMQESFGFKAFSRSSTGIFVLTFDSPMPNANYSVVISSSIHMEFVGTTNKADVTLELRNNSNSTANTDNIFMSSRTNYYYC